MAQALDSLKRTRGPGRPRIRDLAPPQKKRRYIPGGPGGGGRYIDDDDNTATPVVRSGPGRPPRRSMTVRSPTATVGRPRRDRPPARPRYSNSADAAAAVAQNDNKPREEKGWEEYHPDLDIDVDLHVFNADEVDGRVKPAELSRALLAVGGDGDKTPTAASQLQNENASPDDTTPRPSVPSANVDAVVPQPLLMTPVKKRPGRPPRRPESMLNGLGSPPTPRIEPSMINSKEEKLKLTRATFRLVEFEKEFEQSKEHSSKNFVDGTMVKVGYQETDRVPEPDKYVYVRASEGSIEEELDFLQALQAEDEVSTAGHVVGRVEYDMDEQDEVWLEEINTRRRADGAEPIKPAHFEFTMTQIEKEWHALEKRIPKSVPKPPQTHRPRSSSAAAVNGEIAGEEQDSKCAICDDGDADNNNAIVFCDGCDLAVHQECYGVPFIPEGQWMCRKCQLVGRLSPSCIFCPHEDGAFKQTSNGRWAHLLCAIWIPEVSLGNQTFMEPVMDVEKVPKQRWKLNCYICQQKTGACIQCGNKNCFSAFHVSCARKAKLYLKMKSQHGANLDASVLKAFCDKHVPGDWRREHSVDWAIQEAKYTFRKMFQGRRWADAQQSALTMTHQQLPGNELDGEGAEGATSKRKKEKIPKNVWRLPSGAPVVPQAVYERVDQAISKFSIRKKKDYVAEACKYWTLKREARRGAALLKRLQLQLDTFSSMEITRRNFAAMGAAGRPRLQRRIEFAERLEQDMEKVLVLCDMVKQREQEKLEDAEVLKSIVDTVYFPIPPLLWPILEKIQILDAGPKDDGQKYFKASLREIQRRLEERLYTSAMSFATDLQAVFSAAICASTSSDLRPPNDPSGQQALNAKQKDMKKVAKRINGRISGMIAEVQRKEAELCERTLEQQDMINLDSLFDSALRTRQGDVAYSVNGDLTDHATDLEPGSPRKAPSVVHGEPAINGNVVAESSTQITAANGVSTQSHDVDMPDAPGNVANESEGTALQDDVKAKHETADEAIIRLQLVPGGETIPIINSDASEVVENTKTANSTSSSTSSATAPALSTSGSTNPSMQAIDPLTPPYHQTNGVKDEVSAPLYEGGVMWYLDGFEPNGTTIYDERWGGRDALRDMSEDLSEMGSDALEDLIDPSESAIDGKHSSGATSSSLGPPDAQKGRKPGGRRGRRRAYGARVR